MKIGEIRELMRLLDETSLTELQFEADDVKLCLKKGQFVSIANPGIAQVNSEPLPQRSTTPVPVVAPTAGVAGSGGDVSAEEEPDAETGMHYITAPMVGTFYRAPAPDADPYVKKGQQVEPKTIVCIVEAMKLMNELEAEVSGEVVEVLVENGQLVEYGQPLFKIKL